MNYNLYILYFIFYLPYARSTGSSTVTYNGVNSTTTLMLNNSTNVSFSFDIRTRQTDAFVMGISKSDGSYFFIGFKNGNLILVSNIGGSVVNSTIPAEINGEWMNITAESNPASSTTMFKINSRTFNRINDIFGSNWLDFIRSQNLTIGFHNSASVTNFYTNNAFQGCLTNLLFGGVHYNLVSDGVSTDTSKGCTSSIDSCSENPCLNNRTCSDNFNDFICDCGDFYLHKICNETVNITCEFNTTLCRNGAECITLNSDQAVYPPQISDNGADLFKCTCAPGFNGTLCESNINECELGFCENSYNCTDSFGDYQCNCIPGYTSKNCTVNIDDCNPNPCENGGSCTDLIASYNCTCLPQWNNGTNCENDFNECSENTHECRQNSTCINVNGGYECDCLSGTTGNRCQLTADEDDDIEAWIIGVAIGGGLIVIILLILIIYLCCYCRRNSGMEGTYSPNKEEQQSGNIEMNTLKKPNAERLI